MRGLWEVLEKNESLRGEGTSLQNKLEDSSSSKMIEVLLWSCFEGHENDNEVTIAVTD
jgi:hypothetical protein